MPTKKAADLVGEIVERIRRIRRAKEISQQYVADLVPIPRPSFTLIEGGRQKITLWQVARIAEVLGVSFKLMTTGSPENLEENRWADRD